MRSLSQERGGLGDEMLGMSFRALSLRPFLAKATTTPEGLW